MGVCLSSQIKAENTLNTGLNSYSENVSSKERNDVNADSKGSPLTDYSEQETDSDEGDEKMKSSNLKSFSFADLVMATMNFRHDSVLGERESGFGSVFKGWIDEDSYAAAKPGTGLVIAVKKLSQDGNKEGFGEVNYLGHVCHPNIVKLIGFCFEDKYRLLVYEFMPRGSLENHLFRRGSYFQSLTWSLRLKVAHGAAKGLAFLHSAQNKLVYRDFKTSNILLDSDYNAKLSDFGLTKNGPAGDKSPVPAKVSGTYGYAAPEYLATGYLTASSDVYSFGVVLLEMLSGRRAIDKNRPPGEQNLVEWAKPYLTNRKKFLRILDNRLEGQYPLDVAFKAATLALRCISAEPKFRPDMDEVVKSLEQLQDSKGTESNKNNSNNMSCRQFTMDGANRERSLSSYPETCLPPLYA